MKNILQLIAERENDYPGALLEAQKCLLAHLDENESNGPVLTLLAEVQCWLGILCTDDLQKERLLAEGVTFGRKAAELEPDSVAANFWYANSMAEHGMVRGMTNSLFYLEPIETYGNRALELDESYFNAAPLCLMGHVYCSVPPWPVGTGDKKKGLSMAIRAVKLAPDFLYNRLVLSQAYLSARYFDEAREGLEKILLSPKPGDLALSHARCLAEAELLLERLESMV